MLEESIGNITKSDSNSEPTFYIIIYYQNFNGQCLMKNDILIPEKVINIYFLHTRFEVKKFKHRLYIR